MTARVVVLAGRRAAFGGARGPGFVEVAAQHFGIGVLDHGDIGGLLEQEHPAGQPLFGGARARLLDDHRVDAGKLGRVGDAARPGIHRVEHVLLELRAELRELLHHFLEALLPLGRQAHAREPEVLERALQHPALRAVERARFVGRDGAVRAVQRLALREVGPVVSEQRQAGVVAGAQLVGIQHAVQVADRRPGARQPVRELLQRQHRVLEGRVWLCLERGDLAAAALQQLANRRLHVAGAKAVERGEPGSVEFVHFIPSAARTGSVSGRTPRHKVNDSAACSTSMPQPLWARAQPCSMAQVTNGVADLL